MPSTPSVCVFSIDHVPPVAGVKRQAAVSDSTLAQICRQLTSTKLPVTVALAAAPSDELRYAIEQHPTCEVALLATPSWAVDGSSRSQFSQSLAAGLYKLSAVGVNATTLVVPSGKMAAHHDVLVKHGITAARVSEGRLALPDGRRWWLSKRTTTPAAIRPLRWGLWQAVVNVNLAAAGLGVARRLIDRIASQGGTAIIATDTALLTSDAKLLSRLIELLQRRRDESGVSIDSLARAVARHHAPRYAPARSILHSAAA